MAKTKHQKGVKIARDGASNKFTVSWDHGQKAYTDQQMIWYEVYSKTTDKNKKKRHRISHKVNLTKGDKRKSFKIDWDDYPPTGTKRLCYLSVKLKAKSKSGWSDWTKEYSFDIDKPKAPNFNADQKPAPIKNANTATYTWNLYDSGGSQMYHWSHYQVVELENFDGTTIKEVTWKSKYRVKEGYLVYSRIDPYNTIDVPLTILPKGHGRVTQFFRVRTYGPQGFSKWATSWHVFGGGQIPSGVSTKVTNTKGGYIVNVTWKLDSGKYNNPSDEVVVRAASTEPYVSKTSKTNGANFSISCPTSPAPSWTDHSPITDTGGKDRLTFAMDSRPSENEVLFVQVVNKHDTDDTDRASGIFPVKIGNTYGRLTEPTLRTADYNPNTHLVNIQIDHGTTIANSYAAVYVKRGSESASTIRGIIPYGTSSLTIALPDNIAADESLKFGVKNFVANYTYTSNSGIYTYSIGTTYMSSDIVWAGGDVAGPPAVQLSNPEPGTILVTWDWPWAEAQSAELSWSDNMYAWESTEGPTTYVISNNHAGRWRICNLDFGRYYVRVRLIKSGDNYETYGLYSDANTSIDLTADVPPIPTLTIEPAVIAPDSEINCYWQYAAEDGSSQLQADIYEATVDDQGEITYSTRPLVVANTEQHITIDTRPLHWTSATSPRYLAIETVSTYGTRSGRSALASVQIVDQLVVSVSFGTGFTSTVEDDITYYWLNTLPFTMNVEGSDFNGTTSFYIRRATSYLIDRPDGDTAQGYKGEAVFIATIEGETSITVNAADSRIIGSLDDGVRYDVVIIARDQYGQTAKATGSFTINWDHKADEPTASINMDYENSVAILQPIATTPEGDTITVLEGDVCDIYRLTADTPELVYEGALFGSTYVDPYPAFGVNGGYRFAYRTKYNDFKTEEGVPAWTDYGWADNATLDTFDTIIDFDGYQVHLPFNLELSHKWEKDFTETKYLGGAVQGDWNPAVSHTMTINTDVAVEYFSETAQLMRLLAMYPGVCHVRTPDGSSFSADVVVSEDREEKMIRKIAKFSLDITRVDQEIPDGMTYEDWIGTTEEEE